MAMVTRGPDFPKRKNAVMVPGFQSMRLESTCPTSKSEHHLSKWWSLNLDGREFKQSNAVETAWTGTKSSC